jgi:predicted transcriptional regulator
MADDLIPDDVKEFILEILDSVAQLEGLLLLRGNPEAGWKVEELAKRLYIDREQAAKILEHLCTQGLLIVKKAGSTTYHYQPESSELRQMVERLAETYSKYLVPVTNLIHSKPQTRVQQFADAFKIKRRKK